PPTTPRRTEPPRGACSAPRERRNLSRKLFPSREAPSMLKKLLIPAFAVTLAAACTDNSGNGHLNPDAQGVTGTDGGGMGGATGDDGATPEDAGGDAAAPGTGGTTGGGDGSVLDAADLDSAILG